MNVYVYVVLQHSPRQVDDSTVEGVFAEKWWADELAGRLNRKHPDFFAEAVAWELQT